MVLKLCQYCEKIYIRTDFIRKGKNYKTCNKCARHQKKYRDNRRNKLKDITLKFCQGCNKLIKSDDFDHHKGTKAHKAKFQKFIDDMDNQSFRISL